MASLTPGRQSPFRRQPSTNTPRASTPNTSPTKPSLLSPARGGSMPPERSGPFNKQQFDVNTSPITRQDGGFRREGSTSPTKEDTTFKSMGGSPLKSHLDTPSKRFQNDSVVSPSLSIASSVDAANTFDSPSTQILHSVNSPSGTPVVQAAKIKQPVFDNKTPTYMPKSNTTYNSIPAPLLRSFRESFEVLDPNATGVLNPSSLPPVLDQLGLSNEAALSSFFPPSRSSNMNLAAYLDLLSAPLGDLSSSEELAAAFSAFDVDDSGQIDVQDLRQAILRTMPEPGEVNAGARLGEAEVDSILQTFTGRRAFGARGLGAHKASSKGEVFKWREFVGSLNGGQDDRAEAVAV
ncbi:hypothetical protein AMS68_003375 [Peltaster fructicola]|uniref:EF-hand domain-containing protein n=1 Tax=Peltaster fructicola TaxID=286661 RepID=A0A6H0XTB3_9PEZI|nr:hypothetical protein AMS68_003375 [Peltaster fructicola]